MALRRLTTVEMINVSVPMVTEGTEARKAILGHPVMAAVLPMVEAAVEGLREAAKGAENPRLARIQEEEAEADGEHDDLIRGAHYVLTGLTFLAETAEKKDQLARLRDKLLPQGLSTIQLSYRSEAGAAELVADHVADPALKKQLKEIPVHKRTMLHVVEGWVARGRRLGELEDEKTVLLGSAGPSDQARLLAARNQWMRAMNALVANGELANLDPAVDLVLFGPLRTTEKAADRRGKGLPPGPDEPDAAPPADSPPAPPGGKVPA